MTNGLSWAEVWREETEPLQGCMGTERDTWWVTRVKGLREEVETLEAEVRSLKLEATNWVDGGRMGYAGRCTHCGHICAAVLARPNAPQRTAGHIAEFIKDGLFIELLPIEEIRSELQECTCEKEGDDEAA